MIRITIWGMTFLSSSRKRGRFSWHLRRVCRRWDDWGRISLSRVVCVIRMRKIWKRGGGARHRRVRNLGWIWRGSWDRRKRKNRWSSRVCWENEIKHKFWQNLRKFIKKWGKKCRMVQILNKNYWILKKLKICIKI